MNSPSEFEVLVRRRIPFVTTFLFKLMLLLWLILFVLYLAMLPTSYSSGEIKTAYYILVIPEWFKNLSAYSGLGLIIFGPLYYYARLHKPARLRFHQDQISISGKQIDLRFPYKNINKVFCNDLHNLFRKPKGILQFVIRQHRGKETTFRMKHYDEGEKLLNKLTALENTKFAFYNDEMIAEDHDE